MSKLAETYIHIKVDLRRDSFYELKAYLEYIGAVSAKKHFDFDVNIEILLKEGSIQVWLSVAGFLYLGVAHYGSLRSGIDYLVKDCRRFSDYVIERLHKDTDIPEKSFYRTERRLGTPGRIQRLYQKLDEVSRLIDAEDFNSKPLELKRIQTTLRRILDDLESPEEKEFFIKTLPTHVIKTLPIPQPELTPQQTLVDERLPEKNTLRSRTPARELLEKYKAPPKLPL